MGVGGWGGGGGGGGVVVSGPDNGTVLVNL